MARSKYDINVVNGALADMEGHSARLTAREYFHMNRSWERSTESRSPEESARLAENMQVSLRVFQQNQRVKIHACRSMRNILLAQKRFAANAWRRVAVVFSLPLSCAEPELPCRTTPRAIVPRDFLQEITPRDFLPSEELIWPPHTRPAPGPPDKLSRRAQQAQRRQEARNESRRHQRHQRHRQRSTRTVAQWRH